MKKIQALLSLRQPSNRIAMVAAIVVAPMAARADTTFDVSAIVSTLTAAGVACASVGIAYLTVVVGIKTYKLIRHSM
jgi:uncharacterized membrane protein YciS (DUF1049 family)